MGCALELTKIAYLYGLKTTRKIYKSCIMLRSFSSMYFIAKIALVFYFNLCFFSSLFTLLFPFLYGMHLFGELLERIRGWTNTVRGEM